MTEQTQGKYGPETLEPSRSDRKRYVYNDVQIGEELVSYEYLFTQEMVDTFRQSTDDPEARVATIAIRHDATAFDMTYDWAGSVNAGNDLQLFNPPIPGKKIFVTGRITDKYCRRDKPYLVIESTAVDEDGRLLDKLSTTQMQKADEVGKKWQPQS